MRCSGGQCTSRDGATNGSTAVAQDLSSGHGATACGIPLAHRGDERLAGLARGRVGAERVASAPWICAVTTPRSRAGAVKSVPDAAARAPPARRPRRRG